MFARILPPSNIGQVTVGPKDQRPLLALAKDLSEMLSRPAAPVRLNLGNKSAVATPMFAVAAASCRSACRTSGRRRNNSDGSPGGTVGGPVGNASAGASWASSADG